MNIGKAIMKPLLTTLTLIITLGFTAQTLATKIDLNTYFQNDAAPRYMQANDKAAGICIEIMAQLNIRLKSHNISIINPTNERVPIKRILHSLQKTQKIDLFIGGAKTKSRIAAGVQFSTPLYPLSGTFAKRIQYPFIYTDETSLMNMTVGVLRGSRSVHTMSNIAGVKLESTNTMLQSLGKLANGRVDLVYYHDMGLAWQIKNSMLKEQLMLIDKHANIESAPHYILFSSRTSPVIIDLINNMIKAMHKDGSITEILNKYR